MTWSSLKERASTVARTPGLLLAQALLRRVPLRPVDIGKLCFLQLNGVPRVPRALLRGTADVRFATVDDIGLLAQLNDRTPLYRARFAEGDRCLVALVNGRVIGYEWFSENPVHHESVWGYQIAIPDGVIYAYDAYIEPQYRNTGIWLRFKAHLADWMAAHGKRGVLTFVDYGNWPSLRTHLRFGFEPTETVLAFRIVGVRLFRKAPAVGTATWSYLLWLVMHPTPLHVHHAARVVHTLVTHH